MTFHLSESTASTKTMNYYVEALPEDTNKITYNDKEYILYKTISAKYNGVTVEDNIDII